jgi:hypothetical protein
LQIFRYTTPNIQSHDHMLPKRRTRQLPRNNTSGGMDTDLRRGCRCIAV